MQQSPNQSSNPWSYRWDGPPPSSPAQPVQQPFTPPPSLSAYPAQQPFTPSPVYMPQPQPPRPASKKHWSNWLVPVITFFLGLIIGAAAFHGGSAPAPASPTQSGQPASSTQQQATSAPTKAPAPQKWTTVQNFTGNGTKKTAVFAVPGDWKIIWSCKGQDFGGVQDDGVLEVSVYNSDGTIADPAAVNATCKSGQTTSDSTEEHQAGNVYLDVNATGDWSVQVQELK